MCQATLTPRSLAENKTTEKCFSNKPIKLYERNADVIELLFHKIYGSRDDVVISNVRLFSLLLLLDWTSAIHCDNATPVTARGAHR